MKDTRRLMRAIGLDFKKAFFSRRFILTVVGMMFIIVINMLDYMEIDPGVTVCYLFNIRDSVSGFSMSLIFLATVPYASSFHTDYVYNQYKFEIIRLGMRRYSISKLLTTFSAAVISGMSAYLLVAVCLSGVIPIFPTTDLAFSVVAGTQHPLFIELLIMDLKWLYLICSLLSECLRYGFMAVVALYVSTWSSNPFIIYSSPIMIFYGWGALFNTGIIPDVLGWHIFNGIVNEELTLAFNMFFTIVYYSFFALLVGIAFIKGVKRRVSYG